MTQGPIADKVAKALSGRFVVSYCEVVTWLGKAESKHGGLQRHRGVAAKRPDKLTDVQTKLRLVKLSTWAVCSEGKTSY